MEEFTVLCWKPLLYVIEGVLLALLNVHINLLVSWSSVISWRNWLILCLIKFDSCGLFMRFWAWTVSNCAPNMISLSCVSQIIKFLSLFVRNLFRSKFAFIIRSVYQFGIFGMSMLFCVGVWKMLFIAGKGSFCFWSVIFEILFFQYYWDLKRLFDFVSAWRVLKDDVSYYIHIYIFTYNSYYGEDAGRM